MAEDATTSPASSALAHALSLFKSRSTLLSAIKIDLSLVAPVSGLITALPLVAVFSLGLLFTTAQGAIAMAIGANLIAIVSLVGAPRLSLRLALIDALMLGVSVFVGTITGPVAWLHVTLLVPWCFVAGMMVVFGQTQAVVGSQAIIAYVVLGRFSGTTALAVHLSLYVISGALVEIVALVLLRLPPSLRYQRGRLASALEAVSALAESDPHRPATDLLGPLDEAELALSAPSLFSRTDVQDLRAVLDQTRRARLELTTIAGLRNRMRSVNDVGRLTMIEGALREAARTFTAIADELRRPSPTPQWRSALEAYTSLVSQLQSITDIDDSTADVLVRQCVAHLAAIGGQLRSAGQLVEHLHEGENSRSWRPSIPTLRGPDISLFRLNLSTLRDNLSWDSPALRHGVRLAAAVPLSILLGSLLALPRSYWLPYAVAVILKPDYSTLVRRGLGRVIGTMLGATIAAVLVSELHPDLGLTAGLVAMIAWIAYSSWDASFSVSIGFVTAMVLILLSTSTTDTIGTAFDRLVDISLGGALSVAVYLVWPTSPRAGVRESQSQLFAALRDYLAAVVDLVERRPVGEGDVARCSRSVRMAWAKAEAAVGRSVEEPAATHMDPSEGRSLLATTMRILRATHALRIEAERGAVVESFTELEVLTSACIHALDDVGQWIGSQRRVQPVPLRPLYRTAEKILVERGSPASIATHLDELVNAINTASHVAGMDRDS